MEYRLYTLYNGKESYEFLYNESINRESNIKEINERVKKAMINFLRLRKTPLTGFKVRVRMVTYHHLKDRLKDIIFIDPETCKTSTYRPLRMAWQENFRFGS